MEIQEENNNEGNASLTKELLERQAEIRELRGKFDWRGDLDVMRTDSKQLQEWCEGKTDNWKSKSQEGLDSQNQK